MARPDHLESIALRLLDHAAFSGGLDFPNLRAILRKFQQNPLHVPLPKDFHFAHSNAPAPESNSTHPVNVDQDDIDDASIRIICKRLVKNEGFDLHNEGDELSFDIAVTLFDNEYSNLDILFEGLRLVPREARAWTTLVGHGVDFQQLSAETFAVLQIIAAAGDEGISQRELTKRAHRPVRAVALIITTLSRKDHAILVQANADHEARVWHSRFRPIAESYMTDKVKRKANPALASFKPPFNFYPRLVTHNPPSPSREPPPPMFFDPKLTGRDSIPNTNGAGISSEFPTWSPHQPFVAPDSYGTPGSVLQQSLDALAGKVAIPAIPPSMPPKKARANARIPVKSSVQHPTMLEPTLDYGMGSSTIPAHAQGASLGTPYYIDELPNRSSNKRLRFDNEQLHGSVGPLFLVPESGNGPKGVDRSLKRAPRRARAKKKQYDMSDDDEEATSGYSDASSARDTAMVNRPLRRSTQFDASYTRRSLKLSEPGAYIFRPTQYASHKHQGYLGRPKSKLILVIKSEGLRQFDWIQNCPVDDQMPRPPRESSPQEQTLTASETMRSTSLTIVLKSDKLKSLPCFADQSIQESSTREGMIRTNLEPVVRDLPAQRLQHPVNLQPSRASVPPFSAPFLQASISLTSDPTASGHSRHPAASPFERAAPVASSVKKSHDIGAPLDRYSREKDITPKQKQDLVLHILNKAGGAYPGDAELWFPYATAVRDHKGTRTSQQPFYNMINEFVSDGILERHTFLRISSRGDRVPRSIVYLPHLTASSDIVRICQQKMTQRAPMMYFPRGCFVDPGITEMFSAKAKVPVPSLRGDAETSTLLTAQEPPFRLLTPREPQSSPGQEGNFNHRPPLIRAPSGTNDATDVYDLEDQANEEQLSLQGTFQVAGYVHHLSAAPTGNGLSLSKRIRRKGSTGPMMPVRGLSQPTTRQTPPVTPSTNPRKRQRSISATEDDTARSALGSTVAGSYGSVRGTSKPSETLKTNMNASNQSMMNNADSRKAPRKTSQLPAVSAAVVSPPRQSIPAPSRTPIQFTWEPDELTQAAYEQELIREKEVEEQDRHDRAQDTSIPPSINSSAWAIAHHKLASNIRKHHLCLTLMDPGQVFHKYSGTFSTEFAVLRDMRPKLKVNPDLQRAFEDTLPHSLGDIIQQVTRKRTRHSQKTEIEHNLTEVAAWETKNADNLTSAKSLMTPRFINFCADEDPSAALATSSTALSSSPSRSLLGYRASTISPLKSHQSFTSLNTGVASSPGAPSLVRHVSTPPQPSHETNRSSGLGPVQVGQTPNRGSGSVMPSSSSIAITPDSLRSATGTAKRTTPMGPPPVPASNVASELHKPHVEARIIVAVVMVGSLSSATKHIQWPLVSQCFPEFDWKKVQNRWATLKTVRAGIIERFRPVLEEAYLAAYTNGEVPEYSPGEDFDINSTVDWALGVYERFTGLSTASLQRPRTPAVKAPGPSLQEVAASLAQPVKKHDESLSAPISLVRANIMTPPNIYDPERARGRLSVIPDKLLQRSIADLKARGVITTLVKAAGPTIAAARGDASGDYVMDSSFHNMLADAGNLTPGALRAAAQYKLELDEAFRAAGEESVLRLTALTAEQSMCLTYLMTTGAVRALPHFIGSSYQDITVGADGVASGFETRLSAVQDKYKFGLGHVANAPPPAQNASRLQALWYDIHDNLMADVWESFLCKIINICMTSLPTVDDILEKLRGKVERHDVQLALEWLVQCGGLTQAGDRVRLGEWWWAVLGVEPSIIA